MIAVFLLFCIISSVVSSKTSRPVVYNTKSLARNGGDIFNLVRNLREFLVHIIELDKRSALLLEIAETNSIESCRSGWHEINNTCYYFPVYWKMDWTGALETCEGMGSQLLTDIDDSEQMDEFRTVFGEEVDDIWLGAVGNLSTDSWHWINGKPINYTVNWELFLEIGIIDSDLYKCLAWSDGLQVKPCIVQLHFVCQMAKGGNEDNKIVM